MVDSIIFQIHDLEAHAGLLEFLHKTNLQGMSYHKRVVEVRGEKVDTETGEVQGPDSWPEHKHKLTFQRFFVDHESGKSFEEIYRGHLKSHNYNISYGIPLNKNYVEFNFSIPKYLYKTNVFQFVPHYFDGDYTAVRSNDFSAISRVTYERLFRFMVHFFEKELNGQVDLYKVRIVRLDLCYNKIFNSKEDSFRYLHDLMRIRKKFFRDSAHKISQFYSGVYFKSRDYTFKIYHKGSEFRAHDRKELKSLHPTELEDVQTFADRILRYEVEFRTRAMDILFKKYIFRKESLLWKKARRYSQQGTATGYVKIKGKKYHITKLGWDDKSLYQYGKFYDGKVFGFYLRSGSKFAKDSDVWDAEVLRRQFSFEREQKFSSALFSACLQKFHAFYKEFSITYINEMQSIVSKIEFGGKASSVQSEEIRHLLHVKTGQYPAWAKNISFNQVKAFTEMLKTKSFSEIKKDGLVSDSVFYRYQKFFREFGYTDYAATQYIASSTDSFMDYYDHVERVISKLNFTLELKTSF